MARQVAPTTRRIRPPIDGQESNETPTHVHAHAARLDFRRLIIANVTSRRKGGSTRRDLQGRGKPESRTPLPWSNFHSPRVPGGSRHHGGAVGHGIEI